MTAGAIADVKRFSGDPSTNTLNGEAAGLAVAVGAPTGRRWDVEAALELPARTTDLRDHVIIVGRSQVTLQSRARNQMSSVATLVRFRPFALGRVQFGYLAGVSVLRFRRTTDTIAPAGTPASRIPKATERIDYGAAPTFGADARIAMARHLAAVAAFHVTAFSMNDASGLLIRPGIGVRWSF